MRVRNLCKSLAKRLGMVAVVGGMSLGLASDGYAVTIPDSGFEDHEIDFVHASNSNYDGYSYGAAGAYGDLDGFNNASSANGGVSPWQALGDNGNGVEGANASFMFDSTYAFGNINSGDQAIEVQGVLAQNLTDTFGGLGYVATVAGTADGGDDDLVVGLYDASAVTFLATSTTDLILLEPSLVVSTPVVYGAGYSDGTFSFSAASLAGLTGKPIGIAVYSPDATGQGPHIDDVRLDVIPEPGSLALLGLGGVVLAGLRRRK